MADQDVTADWLKQFLQYDPETGFFLRIACQYRPKQAGLIAGCINRRGYVVLSVNGEKIRGHRAAWLYVHGCFPDGQIDHINGIKHDNRIANLRDVTKEVNMQNMRQPRRDNTSGFLGASWHKQHGKWMASIFVDGKARHIGLFSSAELASKAYLEAKRRLHEGCTI